ncbi:DUF4350 domain-containing protein [Subtercola boreus]|uniref:DUF4350 domain-containing protein n=1 Tax=Subtercola boreus TaxID=120213 RepID=A0A3E0WFP7_9MICO|nr:DUF4350 domain-containing protein [Subtercola boreus]RFA22667.1 hypothetical protein B7R24_03370 [Subtercola boreus]RFA23022.1 hypothetical protein B7R23_03365 [Subtercola boreus]RFA28774.1 hypothetical protein B7R25_03380 [Subtercola boreus]
MSGVRAPGSAGAVRAGAVSSTPTVRAFFRRWSFWVGAGVFVLLASLVLLLIRGAGSTGGSELSTTSAAPNGAKAIAEVLRQQGVTVTAVDSLDAAMEAVRSAGGPRTGGGGTGGATVLVYDPSAFLPIDRASDLAALGDDLVLVEPDIFTLDALAPGVAVTGQVEQPHVVDAGCSEPSAARAGSISTSGSAYRATEAGAGSTECFGATADGFSLVRIQGDGSAVTVLGASAILTNEHTIEAGNAALALGLLGAHDTLVWYTPSEADVTASGPPSLAALTPGWVTPLLVLLAVVFLAAAVWRGRRLGPVVVENLPVIVRGSETVAGRARLYARSSARARALDALRIGTVTRVAGLLGLPRSAALPEVIAAVTAVTGVPAVEVAAVLVNREPRSEADLLALSQQLAAIERRVQIAVGRAGPRPAHPAPPSADPDPPSTGLPR